MYQAEVASPLLKNGRSLLAARYSWIRVGRTVFLLGVTSLLTDISAEMVSATLPLYLLVTLRFSPFQVGIVDGIYQGAAVLVNVLGGLTADRWRRPKEVAATGYGVSAVCKLGFLLVGGSWAAISGLMLLDRAGKGVRTAPRDAMIAATSAPERLSTAFGVHRAMDTMGAMMGPLFAVAILSVAPEAYDAVFVVSFCIALIGLAVIVLFVNNPVDEVERDSGDSALESAADRPTVSRRDLLGLIRQTEFRNVLLLGSAFAIVTVSDSLLYLTLRQRLSIPAMMFPFFYVATALIFMIFAIPVGRLADRVGRKVVFLVGYALLAAAYGILLGAHVTYVSAALVFLLMGLFYAATDGILMAMASRTLPPHLCTTGLALLTTGTGVMRLVASALYGALWTAFGAERALVVFGVGLVVVLSAGYSTQRTARY